MAELAESHTGSAERCIMNDAPSRTDPDQVIARRRLHITGVVQGVGFRPFLYRLAQRCGVSGFVRNGGDGVHVEIEGPQRALNTFATACQTEAPPLAQITMFHQQNLLPNAGPEGFVVADSCGTADGAQVPPDIAPCPACIAETQDPQNRRYHYPFTTCTDCGPRLTIVETLPYDRARTTMADFPLCPDCAAEYNDPASRRFHAEAIACPRCGPHLSHTPEDMADVLCAGGIVALKGLGGYHLACDARDEAAVIRLRQRKGRDGKPFAVMVLSPKAARQFVRMTDGEETVLAGPQRPIVILEGIPGALAPAVSNGLGTVGLMLPSSMLHELLLRQMLARGCEALVMTSGNISGEPVLTDDNQARYRLQTVADMIVTHDRRIATRADDSVLRFIGGTPALIRRSRGHAPAAIALAEDGPDVLALGGQLKVTACVLKGRMAHLSAHIGDIETAAAVEAMEAAVAGLLARTGARPRAVLHDLHPDFATTQLALRLARGWNCPALAVQHHHAHAAAIAAEHQIASCTALTLDGFGLGPADTPVRAWGGELITHCGADFIRYGTLAPLCEPGGDKAAREPWRMAAPVLTKLGITVSSRFPDQPQAAQLQGLLQRGAVSSATSSAGRLFDAAAALLGVCEVNSFEAEAAMRLEALADHPAVLADGFILRETKTITELDFSPLLAHLADMTDTRSGANLFHGTLAEGFAALVARCAAPSLPVALAGGCFLNRVLCEALGQRLSEYGFHVLTARQAPCNDGGLALGQALIGRAMLVATTGGAHVSGHTG